MIAEKAMEQIILEAIYKDVELRKVTVSSQHGFTNRISCMTNLITFYSDTTGLVNKRRVENPFSAL